MTGDLVRVVVNVDEELYSWLKEAAWLRWTSMGALVRRAIDLLRSPTEDQLPARTDERGRPRRRLSVQLSAEQHAFLAEEAARTGASMAELVRLGLGRLRGRLEVDDPVHDLEPERRFGAFFMNVLVPAWAEGRLPLPRTGETLVIVGKERRDGASEEEAPADAGSREPGEWGEETTDRAS
jgi:hypothetical protein